VALPANDYVSLGLACGDANASVANNLPSAYGEGSVAGLTLDGQVALANLDTVTTPVGDALSGVLDTVCDTIGETCPATQTVEDLIESVLNTRTLDVTVGKSIAKVDTTADNITSTATANGAVINILPLPVLNGVSSGEPLAKIEVGAAKATAVYNRAAGTTAEPTFDPAVVRITFNTVLNLAPIELAPDQDITILADTPLESRIIVGAGSVVTNADGTKGAVADGVKLQLLEPLGASNATAKDGGITLELAHAEAGVAGQPKIVTPPPALTTNTPDIARELPKTGGNPFIPMAGVVVLAVAVLVRRTTVKAAAK
jgi:LPXTG-motif cell wall-anchored protein